MAQKEPKVGIEAKKRRKGKVARFAGNLRRGQAVLVLSGNDKGRVGKVGGPMPRVFKDAGLDDQLVPVRLFGGRLTYLGPAILRRINARF